MKFKGKAEQQGMTNKNELALFEGRHIATFVNGSLDTDDQGIIAKLKSLGYEAIEEVPKEEPTKKVKK